MFTVKISRAALFAAVGLLSGSVSAQTAGQAAGCGGRDLQADTWVATDALGRTLPGYAECGPRKTNRTVAMFYFVTHNQNGAKDGPYNVTEILKADPVNPKWGGGVHYWGEPEAGYYIMKDEWIIRRHARMLSDAGVDLIVLDNTNDNIYKDVFVFIAEVFRKMRSEGETTPQIACLASQNSVQQLWDQIYSRGLYADLERQAVADVRAAYHRRAPANGRCPFPERDPGFFHDPTKLGVDDAPVVRRRT